MSPRFYVKSFFADTVQAAMETARRELGPDALLLDTKPAPPEARNLGQYEVVFGEYIDVVASQPAARSLPHNPSPAAALPSGRGEARDILSHLSQLVRQRRGNRPVVPVQPPPEAPVPAPLTRVMDELTAAGVEPELARAMAENVKARMERNTVLDISRPYPTTEWDDATLANETRQEIAARCPVLPEIGPVTAFVGPPGAGKTTTLVKLAIAQGLAQGKGVRLLSIDTHRIGAAAQLETYASILGVPFQAVESPAALAQAVDYAPANTLLFIDTPGYSANLFRDLGRDLAALLARRQDIDTHLVLTASMSSDALRRAADLYGAFGPSKLLFTRLDEATSYATILCEAARRQLPLSFFGTGQSIPEDLEPATIERIGESMVRQLPKVMQAIA
jgi:flagellar biosynthesis protein FlhF